MSAHRVQTVHGFVDRDRRALSVYRLQEANQMLLKSLELAASATLVQRMHELRERAASHDRHRLDIRPEFYGYWLDKLVSTARECDPEWCDDIEAACGKSSDT